MRVASLDAAIVCERITRLTDIAVARGWAVTNGLSPVRVPGRGVSGRVALAGFVVSLAAVIAVGLAGRGDAPPLVRTGDEWPSLPATPPASLPWAMAWPASPEPSPVSTCVTPRIEPLAGPVPRHPRDLVPTGLETIGPTAGGVDTLVADIDGGLWGAGAGRLLRFDAQGTLVRTWRFDDDPTLATAWNITPAREGGIWLADASTVSWFDGERFRDVLTAPGGVTDLAEGPDGSLWATVGGTGLYHWDGRIWVPVCGGPADTDVNHVLVDPAGGVWVDFLDWDGGSASAPAGPARFDGRAWTTTSGDIPASDNALLVDRAGALWAIGSDERVARLDGGSWTPVEHEGVDLSGLSSATESPDGSLWLVGGSSTTSAGYLGQGSMPGASVLRFDGVRWTVFGPAQGLPAPNALRPALNAVVAGGEAVFAGSADGLYRLAGDRWTRTWDPTTAPGGPGWLQSIVAVSDDEAWAMDSSWGGSRLWHLAGGRWTSGSSGRDAPTSSSWPSAIAYAGGLLAIADDRGLAVLRGGAWTTLASGVFRAVAVAEDGRTVYAVGGSGEDPGASAVAATFRLTGARWDRTDVAIDPRVTAPVTVDRTGTWWILVGCGWTSCGLDTIREGRVTEVTPPDPGAGAEADGGPPADVGVLAVQAAPNGDVWAVLMGPGEGVDPPPTTVAARYRNGVWHTFGAADGLVGGWSQRIVPAPDGTVWLAGDGLWRYDGVAWTVVRPGWFWDVSFAPDGTALALGPSGVTRLPTEVVRPVPLSDEAASWCADLGHWAAVHAAALALGINEAAIDSRTVAIMKARGEAEDPAAFQQVRRLDGEYVRACGKAFAAADS